MYRKVLAAVNEHVNSEVAARYAKHLARAAGAKLILCSIREPGQTEAAFELARDAAKRLQHRARELNIDAECLFDEGDPVEKIRAIVLGEGVDLVFTATRREDVWRRLARRGATARRFRRIYLEDRPARKAVEARIRKGDLLVRQAEYEGKPDFEVAASYMQRNKMPDGTNRPDMVSAMVSMTLPVWRKGKVEPGVRAMTAEKEMAVRDGEALDNESANVIGWSLSSVGNFVSVAALYRTTLIPQAEQAVQSNLEAYRVGKVDLPMLMDSVMTVLAFRKERLGMVGEMHMTKARLEAAVGRELP